MLIHVICRPLSDTSHIPTSGIKSVVDNLRHAGATVIEDIGIAHGDFSRAVTELSEQLSSQWEQNPPQMVHSIGLVATVAALAARPEGTRILATFDERPVSEKFEKELARQVDGVIPLSTAEQSQWRALGVKTHAAGTLLISAPAVEESPVSQRGYVVCQSSSAPGLKKVVESMAYWPQNRLVLMGPLSDCTRAAVRTRATELGVQDRIDYRPGPRGEDREQVWSKAALLIAGNDGSRHGGHVLEAAAHGVPSVALAREAHLDHIVPGATGILIESREGSRGLGQAVATLLQDPLRCRGMGSAALVRTQALHGQSVLGERLLNIYRKVSGAQEVVSTSKNGPISPEATELAIAYLPLARQLAHRYAGRGQRTEDLVQVASLGLVRAASRFNPDYGTEFHSFAVPTILGELRRHFRDHAWAAHVPRSLQEATLKVQKVSDELRASRGHDASPAEVADHLGLLESEVRQAMQARGEAMSSKSLDHPMGEDGDETFGDLVGDVDPDLEYIDLREAVNGALLHLPEREREILLLRFYGEHTQSEIAERLGLSQVHVSRLITRTLSALRENALNDVPLPRSWSLEVVSGKSASNTRRAA